MYKHGSYYYDLVRGINSSTKPESLFIPKGASYRKVGIGSIPLLGSHKLIELLGGWNFHFRQDSSSQSCSKGGRCSRESQHTREVGRATRPAGFVPSSSLRAATQDTQFDGVVHFLFRLHPAPLRVYAPLCVIYIGYSPLWIIPRACAMDWTLSSLPQWHFLMRQ